MAWDLETGAVVEQWPDVFAYDALQGGTLLAFYGPSQVQIARTTPRERLVTVHLLSDSAALAASPDGRFELLGDRRDGAVHLRCRLEHVALPFSACAERYEWPGLLSERLARRLGP